MRIIIADILSNTINGKQTGHYFALARNYLEIFGDGCKVAGGPVYKSAFQEKELIVLPYNNIDDDSVLRIRLRTFANARRLFNDANGDIIVLQQCTTITTFLCVLLFYRQRARSKLFFIQYNKSGLRQWVGRLLFNLVKNKIDGIICPNEGVGESYGLPYCVVPDYIYTGSNTTQTIGYSSKPYDFCMIGRISEEKGIIEAARRFARTPYKVLIAGRPNTEELGSKLQGICDGASNIILKMDFLSDEDFSLCLENSKYAILNYQGEYSQRSSGVVYDTLFAGVPVVGCKCKALNFVEMYGMGYLYDDIIKFNPTDVLSEEKYRIYQQRISDYRLTHQLHKGRLREFLFH